MMTPEKWYYYCDGCGRVLGSDFLVVTVHTTLGKTYHKRYCEKCEKEMRGKPLGN